MSSKIFVNKFIRTRASSISSSPKLSYIGGNPNRISSWELIYGNSNNSKDNIIKKINSNKFLRRAQKWMT